MKEALNKLISFMVRPFDKLTAHHERNQQLAVRPERVEGLNQSFLNEPPATYLRVSIARQTLELIEEGVVVRTYPVSTAKSGPGERRGSGCTPRGWHRIRARIGEGLPSNTVFVGRRPTGEFYDSALAARRPERDWILGRILWLGGLEPGVNRYGEVDTAWRYIYIHGSPDEGVTGRPESHGCIRMRCPDVLDLFERLSTGVRVHVGE